MIESRVGEAPTAPRRRNTEALAQLRPEVRAALAALPEWHRRLILTAERMRAEQNRAKLLVEFEGPVMTLWKVSPDGRVSSE